MLQQHFIVEETYLHVFPARALPFRVPDALHRWLDKNLGYDLCLCEKTLVKYAVL